MTILVSLQTPAQIVNASLIRIGHRWRIGSLNDGSEAAKMALFVYGQTRDALLRDEDPSFARRDVTATLLKQAPTGGYIPPIYWNETQYPPLPWFYEYTFPTDAIEVRYLRYGPLFIPNFDPQPNAFDIANDDTYSPAQKVVLSNVGPRAVMTYVGRITDPTTWDVGFTESLVASLARRLTVALGDPKLIAAMAQDEVAQTAMAEAGQG